MRTVTTPQQSKRRITGYTLIAAAAFLFAAQATLAQEAEQAPPGAASQQNTDPPGRVARLNYTAGAVTTEPAGATDWSYAQINRPLTTGDQLWNDQNARSELHIGSTAVRLDQSTSLDILNLDDNSAQLKVAQGTLSARVRELAPGSSYEIDTPNVALGLNGPGDYRVDVAPDGSSTTVTVRSGSATVYGDSGQVPVAAGQQIRFAGTNLQQVADNGAPGLDGFDQWAASRDAAEDRSVSARYVSRDIPGYQDLDANGTWRSSPQYGEVWVPRATPAGWAPYHDGHWVWQAPWGWTWVDDAPWGFAPYHYGRWAYVDDSWAWVPGPVVVSEPPVYAPALVAFVGGGGGGVDWGVSLAIGGAVAAGVAWFPLGPGEPWHPHWGDHDHWSPGYYNRVNNTTVVNNYNRNVTNVNVTNIHNTYINYRAPGGVTAVPATAFVHGQSVGRFAQKVDPQQWRNARINPGGPGIAPVKESFGPGLRNANYRPPAGAMARPVVATRSPAVPAAYHDSLAQRFAQSGGRVPGAGAPIVRTSVPAHMAGGPGAMPVQNVRVVQSHMAGRTPGAAPGAPGVAGAPNGTQQAGQRPGEAPVNGQPQRGGEPQARPGMPPQVANVHQQPAEAAHPSNGVPRPPQANGANPNAFAQQHGAPVQAGQQPGAEGRHEPAWTQPHTPMAQQAQQHGAPQEQARPEQQQQAAQRQQEAQPQRAPEVRAQPQEPRPQPAQEAQQQPRQENRPQPQQEQQPRAQQVQQPRPEPRPQQVQQPRPEPRPQQVQQPRPEPRPQQVQQPRPEPRPQQVQQPRPQQQPQRAEQPHPQPQPQHAEQHSGGGNRDEHHKG
ncbi:hypothetical protein R75461_01894 [Paraburkholderia nemoris]|uniref:DUF6600 domain-containing protein n=1 Tax=Paraburkholderia nemoris TaxID=2793076 RepID=UPI001909A6F4|nr:MULTISPECIES: DUF6600 domain-containing protein [Paraburkholderia]MBK3741782.1 FecR protein [Paraburkholderia aspalathi]MBK3781769.1 FecR protein [Paraburkholderia aspalathi]CAE6691089.1 hypothetical protein LMG22931_00370 [Paraburkholderia nemoris]CAE6728995.1 hypothetical protein R75461_01894 [Paraburkholderia nemoris]CAE6764144.1 hypothetical protein R69619_03517 [Paraburkholderia nemoris]